MNEDGSFGFEAIRAQSGVEVAEAFRAKDRNEATACSEQPRRASAKVGDPTCNLMAREFFFGSYVGLPRTIAQIRRIGYDERRRFGKRRRQKVANVGTKRPNAIGKPVDFSVSGDEFRIIGLDFYRRDPPHLLGTGEQERNDPGAAAEFHGKSIGLRTNECGKQVGVRPKGQPLLFLNQTQMLIYDIQTLVSSDFRIR